MNGASPEEIVRSVEITIMIIFWFLFFLYCGFFFAFWRITQINKKLKTLLELQKQNEILKVQKEIYKELVKLNVSIEHLINIKVDENGTNNKE
jgi:predicted PurR-regulated permease PerM